MLHRGDYQEPIEIDEGHDVDDAPETAELEEEDETEQAPKKV